MEIYTLKKLMEGFEGEIDFVSGKSSLRRHLFELGFLPGTKVYCVRYNKLLDSITVRLRGATVCIRNCDAELINLK
jgi:ferrous iron transport protein A